MRTKIPTKSEQIVLDELSNSRKWRPPSMSELARRLGYKSNTYVLKCLQELEKKGYVRRVAEAKAYYMPL